MDPLDFLDAPVGADDAVTPAAEAAPAEAPAAESPPAEAAPLGQPGEPEGRATPKDERSEGAAERDGDRVPLGELKAERTKRQAAEARIRELEAAKPAPAPVPDRYDEPEAWEAHQQQLQDDRFQKVEDARNNDRFNFSERMAKKDHGAELFDQAKTWGLDRASKDVSFAQAVFREADPYEFVVSEFKRHQTTVALNDPKTLEDFNAWRAAQAAGAAGQPGAQPAAAPAATTTTTSRPTRSIAGAPAAGAGKPGEEPVGPGNAFDATIKG